MAELVAETGIIRERGYAYFLKGAEVWRRPKKPAAGTEGEPEMVWRGTFTCNPEFLYFIDAKGNISRASKASLAAEEQQFADVHLQVAGTRNEPTATVVEAKVSSGAIEIALRTDFALRSPEKGAGPALPVHAAGVELRSVGAASDAFLQALSAIYGLGNVARKMKARVPLPALGLRGNPAAATSEAVHLKLFSPNGSPPFELYLDIDILGKSIRIGEKDSSYRAAVVAFLSEDG